MTPSNLDALIAELHAWATLRVTTDRWSFSFVDPTRELLLRAADALSAAKAQGAWQPIETAPKDGTRILAVVGDEVRVVAYGKTSHVPIYGFNLADQGPEDFDLCTPTLWQALPTAPEATS